ncbi:MAG: hypothetical protein SO116_07535 [Treponema sp.]|nr:hypothetical protein [Spirochaetia bacterium]MDD7015195.1 hypothetical protein [Spirochaetales bacterium]MDY4902706.1 hypothetical protein [Treponema sp.]
MRFIAKRLTFLTMTVSALLAVSSCASSKQDSSAFEEVVVPTVPPPPVLTELPVIEYTGAGIKYEIESMLLHQFLVTFDKDASGKYCARLTSEAATAMLKVKFPAGTYECLVREKASDNEHAAFYVYLDGVPYRVYPSDPPLGTWELTTRVPVYFTIDEPRTILVKIQANSERKLGSIGMSLDYIQFVKRD